MTCKLSDSSFRRYGTHTHERVGTLPPQTEPLLQTFVAGAQSFWLSHIFYKEIQLL